MSSQISSRRSLTTGHATKKVVATAVLAIVALLLIACRPSPRAPLVSPETLSPSARLMSVSFVDADRGWVVAADCGNVAGTPTAGCRSFVYATDDGGRSWSPRGRILLWPRKIFFTDKSSGWLIGSIGQQCGNTVCPNVIMRTSDGGRTWERASTTSGPLIDGRFTSPIDGWVLGESCSNPSRCVPVLITTVSTGELWTNQELPLSGHGFRMERVGPTAGLVGGVEKNRGVLVATQDGGRNWEKIDVPCQGEGFAFDFLDIQHGWLLCGPSTANAAESGLLRTGDGGKTWQSLSTVPISFSSRGESAGAVNLTFVSPLDGWIVDGHHAVLATHDGGKSWREVLTVEASSVAGAATESPPVEAQFLGTTRGWVVVNQAVWRTTDAGKTWDKTTVNGDSRGASGTM